MEKVFVYRLENSKGVGPYQAIHKLKSKLCREHSKEKAGGFSHPSWNVDGITESMWDDSKLNHLSGFTTIGDLYSWFAGYFQALLKQGFMIKKYYVNKRDIVYGKSGKQIAFFK